MAESNPNPNSNSNRRILTIHKKIRWVFTDITFNPSLLFEEGDLIYIEYPFRTYDLKIYKNGAIVPFTPDEGLNVSEIIVTRPSGEIVPKFGYKHVKGRKQYWVSLIDQSTTTETLTTLTNVDGNLIYTDENGDENIIADCCSEPCTYSISTLEIQADTSTLVPPNGFEFSDLITVNGVVQEIHTSLQIQSVDAQGVITFNSEYQLFVGDIVIFRKCIGAGISVVVAQVESSTFQAPQGFEDYSILTVNGIVYEIHTDLQVQSVVNGLITFNSEYSIETGDVLVFRK